MLSNRSLEIYSDCVAKFKPISTFDLFEEKKSARFDLFKTQASMTDLTGTIKETILSADKLLPFASEKYNISRDIKDYILCCVVVLPSDIPNKNGIAFPHRELSSFCVDAGNLVYRTFDNKPIHLEHNNKDPSIAKGIILSSHYRKLNGFKGDMWKVVCLGAIDRNRDTALAKKVLDDKETGFSLGALCADYTCSITKNLFSSGMAEQYTQLKVPSFRTVAGQVAFLNAVDPMFFEMSVVENPAFPSAATPYKAIF